MERQAACINNPKNHPLSKTARFDRFYSAEVLLNGLNMLYQFKIWKKPSKPMFAIVKENSAILDCLNVGDTFTMKYYSSDSLCPTEDLDTKIKYITLEDQGRFKGHYLIGLEIKHDAGISNFH